MGSKSEDLVERPGKFEEQPIHRQVVKRDDETSGEERLVRKKREIDDRLGMTQLPHDEREPNREASANDYYAVVTSEP